MGACANWVPDSGANWEPGAGANWVPDSGENWVLGAGANWAPVSGAKWVPFLVHWVLGASGCWVPVGAGSQWELGASANLFFFIQEKFGFPLLMHLCALLMSTQVRNPIN